jgi:hypothetical protein
MAKGKSLPNALKTLLKEPTFPARQSKVRPGTYLPAGRAAGPTGAPADATLKAAFQRMSDDATSRGVGWGEWLSLAVGISVEQTGIQGGLPSPPLLSDGYVGHTQLS